MRKREMCSQNGRGKEIRNASENDEERYSQWRGRFEGKVNMEMWKWQEKGGK